MDRKKLWKMHDDINDELHGVEKFLKTLPDDERETVFEQIKTISRVITKVGTIVEYYGKTFPDE